MVRLRIFSIIICISILIFFVSQKSLPFPSLPFPSLPSEPKLPTSEDVLETARQISKFAGWFVLSIFGGFFSGGWDFLKKKSLGGLKDIFTNFCKNLTNQVLKFDPINGLEDASGLPQDVIQAVDQHGGSQYLKTLLARFKPVREFLRLKTYQTYQGVVEEVSGIPMDLVDLCNQTGGGLLGSTLLGSTLVGKFQKLAMFLLDRFEQNEMVRVASGTPLPLEPPIIDAVDPNLAVFSVGLFLFLSVVPTILRLYLRSLANSVETVETVETTSVETILE